MKINLLIKKILAPYIYRHKPIGLSAGKLYLYLDALYKTKQVQGDVVEVGCNVCGTTALGKQMLRKMDSSKEYYCVDTFGGFVEEQFQSDQKKGTPDKKKKAFSNNDIELARKVLKIHKSESVKLIQADIVKLPADQLPKQISLCLLDVDLYEPIYAGLEKVLPRMAKGGVILVDDCGGATWKAGEAFKDFVAKHQITSWSNEFGMGIIRF